MPADSPVRSPPPLAEAGVQRASGGRVGAKAGWVAVAIAAAVVVGVGGFAAIMWTELGDAGLSLGGWLAMGLGILATLALGIGLMALVFISSRRGYDEPGGPPL